MFLSILPTIYCFILIVILIYYLYDLIILIYQNYKIKNLDYYKYSKKEYEEDYDYLINFLKENHPYSFKINFEELKKHKYNVCNCIDIIDFYYKIVNEKELYPNKIGHFDRISINHIIYKDDISSNNEYKYYDKRYLSIFKNYEYYLSNFINYDISFNNKFNSILSKEIIPFKFKVIKNDKNEDSIYINIKQMDPITNKNYEELSNFINKYKDLKNIYIDIRNNQGGSIETVDTLLFNILYNNLYNTFYIYDYQRGYCKNKKMFNKVYLKYTNYNANFKDLLFNNPNINDYSLIKLSNNTNFSHLYYYSYNQIYYPNHNINIIINSKVASAAQYLIDKIYNCTIYGDEPSFGFGLKNVLYDRYNDPIFILPHTKLIFRYEYAYVEDEINKSYPHYKIPIFLKTKEIIDF